MKRYLRRSLLNCLSEPAVLLRDDYSIVAGNEAYRKRFSGGDFVAGQRCFRVSHKYDEPCSQHGISCPMEMCRETGEPTRVVHCHHTPDGEALEEVIVRPALDDDGNRTRCYVEILLPVAVASAQADSRRMVGRSPSFNKMLEMMERVAPSDTTVLLTGESGTGKELVAEAIHKSSRRHRGPFVPLDCPGLSESLFESELFGHEKGSFTGALNRKIGLVEAAGSGTLFLDEVGDIPLAQQVKLLRLIETGRFRRVGSTEQMKGDFRLICATHRDLKKMTDEGTFRADLYYRINAFPIRLPPLRERREDIPLLVESMIGRLNCSGQCKLHSETLKKLRSYRFPGNVRELVNILERACLLADGDTIAPEHLPEECHEDTARSPLVPEGTIVPLEQIEDRYLRWAADSFRGDNRDLARQLGVSERTLYRRLKKLRQNENRSAEEASQAMYF